MRRIWAVVLCGVMAFAAGDAFAKKKKKRGKKKKGAPSGEMAGGGGGARPYGMAGCGLGAVVMGADGNQILAGTINNIVFPQTSAITTGSSNCVDSATAAAIVKQEQFITTNLPTIMKEMSQGEGETLQAFSATLGCDAAVYPTVASELKENFTDIFRAPGALAVLDTAKSKLARNPKLAGACGYLVI